jgi:hypothetical protein
MKRQPRRRTASTVADAFSVDPEALADAMHRMGEFMQHTESVVAEIDSLVTHLHQTWSGEAATAHAEAHRHWSQGEAIGHHDFDHVAVRMQRDGR